MAELPDQVSERTQDAAEKAEEASDQVAEQVDAAKSAVTEPLPAPPGITGRQAEPKELLERLNWGEPALTIIDTRDRQAFNSERIMGAVPMPVEQIPQGVESQLERNRDIYIYGESADEAAGQLRQAGFENVAVISGGLSSWKKAGGPTEGVDAFSSPAQSAASS